jgi:hypothetical protein
LVPCAFNRGLLLTARRFRAPIPTREQHSEIGIILPTPPSWKGREPVRQLPPFRVPRHVSCCSLCPLHPGGDRHQYSHALRASRRLPRKRIPATRGNQHIPQATLAPQCKYWIREPGQVFRLLRVTVCRARTDPRTHIAGECRLPILPYPNTPDEAGRSAPQYQESRRA